MTRSAARDALPGLVRAARAGGARARARGAAQLGALSGRDWLQLDDGARGPDHLPGTVAGARGWLGPTSRERSGFAVAIASLHVDGRIRERATLLLAERPGALRSAALAVRCLDHVPQVRAAALAATLTRLAAEDAEAVLGVLTAASRRTAARAALATYTDHLLRSPTARATVSALRASRDRDIRRWAFQAALDHDLLGPDEALRAAVGDPDQEVRARCCTWLGAAGDASQLMELLTARSADGRVVALQHLAEEDLSDEQLHDCLLDRSARVRASAQWRARRRGLDVVQVCRRALSDDPTRTTAALAGLAEVGSDSDLDLIEPCLQDARPAVRTVAVRALAAHLPADAAQQRLPEALLDPSPRVARAAARALQRLGAPPAAAGPAWQSRQTWSRRAAWHLQRSGGGWQRVEADLRASDDADSALAEAGRSGVRNWLVHGAATTWQSPSGAQEVLFRRLLPTSGLDRDTQRVLAFHAGLAPPPVPPAPQPAQTVEPEPAPGPGRPGAGTSGPGPRRLDLAARIARAWGRRS